MSKTIKPQSIVALSLIFVILLSLFGSVYLYYWFFYVYQEDEDVWTFPNTTSTRRTTTTYLTPVYRVSTKYPTTTTTTTEAPPEVSDEALSSLIEKMITADMKTRPVKVTINWQAITSRKSKVDKAPAPMFGKIDLSKLEAIPRYNSYMKLIGGDYFAPRRTVDETTLHDNEAFHKEVSTFVYGIMDTEVFQLAQNFSCAHGRLQCVRDDAYRQLFVMWFDLYTRGKSDEMSSSGFEHVFVGEMTGNKVSGQHYWLRNYLLEQRNEFDYHGYLFRKDDLVGTMQYTWIEIDSNNNTYTYLKAIGGFMIGTNPELDFGLFTLCFLFRVNRHCEFTYDNSSYAIVSYPMKGTPYISTTYPILK